MEKKENHLLDGLLYCGDCGHRISVGARREVDNRCYTICNYYRTYMKERLCTLHCNNYDILEQTVIDSLKTSCLNYINKNTIKNTVKNKLNDLNDVSGKREISLLEQEIKQINDNLDTIYIDKLNKVINEDQFNRVKIKLLRELNIKQEKLNNLIVDDTINIDNNKKEKLLNKYINDFLEMKEPSRELIVNLIDKIEIFEDKRVNIILSFKNE